MFREDATKRNASAWKIKAQDGAQPNPSDLIQVCTEDDENPNGNVVYANASRTNLLRAIPALEKFIDDQGRIFLPGARCGIDDDTLWEVIHAALESSGNGDLPLNVAEEPEDYINKHVILTLFEKHDMALQLQNRLWELLQRTVPTIDTITWIWNLFGNYPGSGDKSYNPPFAEFYVQTMAWQILNLHNVGSLPEVVTNYIVSGSEVLQDGLKQAIEEREKKYGLSQGYEHPKEIVKKPSENPFANVPLPGGFKDEAKPPERIYHAKNYLEKNLWKGRDLNAQPDPIAPANTSPNFKFDKARAGISGSSVSKNANTPGMVDPDADSSSEDEGARWEALSSPSPANPFNRLPGVKGLAKRELQLSAQQAQRLAKQGQPPSQEQAPPVQAKAFGMGGAQMQPNRQAQTVNPQPTSSAQNLAILKNFAFGNTQGAQQNLSQLQNTTSQSTVDYGFGSPRETRQNLPQVQNTTSQDTVNFGFGGRRRAQQSQFQAQGQNPVGPGTQSSQQSNTNTALFYGGFSHNAAAPFGSPMPDQGTSSTFGVGTTQQNTTPTFGVGTPQQGTTSAFGNATPQQNTASPFAFGQSGTPQSTNNAPVMFGSNSTPNIAFGASNQNPQSTLPASSTFNISNPAFADSTANEFGASAGETQSSNPFAPQTPARRLARPKGRFGRRP